MGLMWFIRFRFRNLGDYSAERCAVLQTNVVSSLAWNNKDIDIELMTAGR